MAKLPGAFNANQHGEMNSFEAVPTGDYLIKVVKSEMKKCSEKSKDPNGQYLSVEFEILAPVQFKGKKLFTNLNLINKSAQAVEIANKELGTICRAVGKIAIQDSSELHGIPMLAKVVEVPDNRGDKYPPKNEIRNYLRADGVNVPAQEQSAGEEAKPGKKPWE